MDAVRSWYGRRSRTCCSMERRRRSYDALAAGVLVSLGTDWAPSGSPNLLTELKVADRALRDALLLGGRRALVPSLAPRARR